MKLDLNITKWFLDFELPPIDELVQKIGAQLGAVDEVIDIGGRYTEVVLVKVVACEKHPNADKLSICKIDDDQTVKDVERDSDGLVQVVCGAPNVHAGMTAVWLPPGTTVPNTVGKEPFVLGARELRGQKSNGMLASPSELALGDGHAGILELDGDHNKPGTDFAVACGLKGDFVIDIENKMFTHRPDCFGFLGVARELAGIYHQSFKSPDWYVPNPTFVEAEGQKLPLVVKNELPELVPRFTAITLSDVQVGASPLWLQDGLSRLGQKSVNNVVDYSNWYMLETGQPIHVYDYDKVKSLSGSDAATMVVRNPKPGEKIKLLNGKEIEPRPEAMMVATDKQLICVGGAIGGTATEVDETTKNIIVEAANWDMFNMRRTAMEHGIFTDAVTRFTKGQSPLQNLAVLSRITKEICEHAGGKVAGPVIDDNRLSQEQLERGSVHPPIKLPTGFINDRLGLKLSANEIKKILENVEFTVDVTGDELTVKAPFWRTDVELREDVVEEVGRLHGYDRLPLELPRRDLTPAHRDPLLELKAQLRARLAKAGANEVLTYSFVHGGLLTKTGQDSAKAFEIANALSPDLQYYRISLMPSLLEKVHPNIKAGYDEFALFELGKTHGLDHLNDEGLPAEFEFTALVATAADKLKRTGAAYYQAQIYLNNLIGRELTFKPIGDDMARYPVVQPYERSRSALVSAKGGGFLGVIGEFKSSVARSLKLPKYTAGFEIDTAVLQPLLAAGPRYVQLSRFPRLTQDITLRVPTELSYQKLYDSIRSELDKAAPKNTLSTLSPVDIYQKSDDPKHKNMTFRLSLASYERTLTDAEVNQLLETIAAATQAEFSTQRV